MAPERSGQRSHSSTPVRVRAKPRETGYLGQPRARGTQIIWAEDRSLLGSRREPVFGAATPTIFVVTEYAMPAFSERLIALLHAVFPDARLERIERADEAKLQIESADRLVVVLVYAKSQQLDELRKRLTDTQLLCLHVPSAHSEPKMIDQTCCRAIDPEQVEDLVGQIAQRMELPRAVELAAHRGKIAELSRVAADLGRSATERRLRRLIPFAMAAGTVLIAAASWKIWDFTREPPSLERFGFETVITPWQCQNAAGVRGCISARQSRTMSKIGTGSLEMVADLDPGDPERRIGEIWAALPSGDSTVPLDLEGRRVSAWVRPSPEVSGSVGHRSSFQIYAKDTNWRSCYGPVTEASPNHWLQLQLLVGASSAGQFVEPGFDGHAIAGIGIKLALPTNPGERVSGVAHVDAIEW